MVEVVAGADVLVGRGVTPGGVRRGGGQGGY